jgi:hypothetical protein
VHFEVTAADGTKSQHRCELRSATTLRRSGWTPEMFAAGQIITIQGSPDRAEKNACSATARCSIATVSASKRRP